jgi:small-conductance mechanosensitive channel
MHVLRSYCFDFMFRLKHFAWRIAIIDATGQYELSPKQRNTRPMEQPNAWGTKLAASLQSLLQDLASYLPIVLLAAALVLTGWLVARFLRRVTFRMIQRLDWLFHESEDPSGDEGALVQLTAARAISAVVFWTVMLSFVAAAIRSLGWSAAEAWTEDLLAYAPVLIGGIAIIVFGFIGGTLVRQVIESAASSASASYGTLLGRLSQVTVVLTGFVIGVTHLGIDVTFLVEVTSVLVGTITAGIALTLALGTRKHLSNLIGIRYLQKHYQVGDWIQVGEFRGQITEMSDGYLFLESDAGDVSIPGDKLASEPMIKITGEVPHDGR